MNWNWQQSDWPTFRWSAKRLAKAEAQFLIGAGVVMGASSHLDSEGYDRLTVESLGEEAVTTSEIEGEVLDRHSVQSSVRRQLGLATDNRGASPAERGVAEMMVDLHRTIEAPLTANALCSWHRMLMQGRPNLQEIGRYRTHSEPMRVLSGRVDSPRIHFEAPPSSRVPEEMEVFLAWFDETGPAGSAPLPALTRAGTAHLYFECIHPFEDGNGRVGRAVAEKALAQCLEHPSLTALAPTILARRGSYYEMLELSNKKNEITEWLAWFAGIALEAQQRLQVQVEFLIDKTRFLDGLRGKLNARQERVLIRVLREGPDGFEGGLSAGNYVSIARTSPATARRDLGDLVRKGALTRTGERRHVRYHTTIPLRPVSRVTIDELGNIQM